MVSFCYIDEGVLSPTGFVTFLAHYARLFVALVQFRVVYVAATERHFRTAEGRFQGWLERCRALGQAHVDPVVNRMRDYFQLRHWYEARQMENLDRAKLDRLRDGRDEFQGERVEQLYRSWQSQGDRAVVGEKSRAGAGNQALIGEFVTCRMSHNYNLFGTAARGN